MADINAASGYWSDIQDAMDLASDGDDVYIPEGIFNFVNVDEGWSDIRVEIPAGVNLFGAATERDENGQVTSYGTTLNLPWDVPGSWLGGDGDPPERGGPTAPWWFSIEGTGNASERSRFSDIKLVGYRAIDNESVMIVKGLYIEGMVNFRVDHVEFEDIAGGGIKTQDSNGLIDHCNFTNSAAYVEADYQFCTVGYGVQINRALGDLWEDDISKILGQATSYTVFIEDCYLEKWRHCTSSGQGAHYVIRYCTIQNDMGYYSIDAHGRTTTSNGTVTQVGTRATEIYENALTDAVFSFRGSHIRGGSGVAFNNTIGGGTYTLFIRFINEPVGVPKCNVNDWWVWDNIIDGITLIVEYDPEEEITEGENYFLYEPHTFSYQPYQYPHPLQGKTRRTKLAYKSWKRKSKFF